LLLHWGLLPQSLPIAMIPTWLRLFVSLYEGLLASGDDLGFQRGLAPILAIGFFTLFFYILLRIIIWRVKKRRPQTSPEPETEPETE